MSHTPTPWVVENLSLTTLDGKSRQNFGIITEHGHRVALLGQNQEANANFIVLACNAHEDLLLAAKDACLFIKELAEVLGPNVKHTESITFQRLLKAIEKAEEKL